MDPMQWISYPIALIRRRYLPSYLLMNALFYGCIALGMAIVMARPQIQDPILHALKQDMQGPAWSPVVNAYTGGHIIRAAAITLGVNLVLGTLVMITIPSLLIPFIGIVIGTYRALLWGLVFGPTPHGISGTLATHWPVMLLEGQGYVLGMLGVYIHGKALVKPNSVGAAGAWSGYRRGLYESMRIYPLITLVLAISAVYESLEVIHVANRQATLR